MNNVHQSLLNCGRILVRTLASGLHVRAVSYCLENANNQLKGGHKPNWTFVSVCCGFPKDFLFGPSTVRDPFSFGEDACFIAKHKSTHVVGVADGVGGWREYGIDSSAFSRSLMRECSEIVESGQFRPSAPAHLLGEAYKELYRIRTDISNMKECDEPIGSSTACVVVLDKGTSQMHSANLGDSGFIVVRKGRVVHRSVEQCHYFNAPFQLALPPDNVRNCFSDSPESAETSTFVVQEGDVLLVATDGLFDNLPIEMIEKQFADFQVIDEMSLQEICNSLALQARQLSIDRNHMSPFALKARDFGIQATGGKPDDITLVLVLVTADETNNAEQNDT